jgi:hypothetical protein
MAAAVRRRMVSNAVFITVMRHCIRNGVHAIIYESLTFF